VREVELLVAAVLAVAQLNVGSRAAMVARLGEDGLLPPGGHAPGLRTW